MEHRYKVLMRSVRLYLRREQRKKTRMARILNTRIFHEEYWHWARDPVAVGAGWGAVSAILPVPMQSFWGIAACLWRKGNIPMAVLMAWLSPPGSIVVIVPAQWWLGWWILIHCGFTGSGAHSQMLEKILTHMHSTWTWSPSTWLFPSFSGINVWMMGVEFLIGLTLSCLILAFACYGLVIALWPLFHRKQPLEKQVDIIVEKD